MGEVVSLVDSATTGRCPGGGEPTTYAWVVVVVLVGDVVVEGVVDVVVAVPEAGVAVVQVVPSAPEAEGDDED